MSAKGTSNGEEIGKGDGWGGRLGTGATGNVVMLQSTEETLKGC